MCTVKDGHENVYDHTKKKSTDDVILMNKKYRAHLSLVVILISVSFEQLSPVQKTSGQLIQCAVSCPKCVCNVSFIFSHFDQSIYK